MNTNPEFIKKSLSDMVIDKLNNMYESEISEEVFDFLKGKEDLVVNAAYEIFVNNKVINTKYRIKAIDEYNYGLIEDWSYDEFENVIELTDDIIDNCSEDTMNEISYDALYNYDALWMTAIQKAFPDNVTKIQCGWGQLN